MYSLLIKNGNILTMDGKMSRKRWLAADEAGKIAALGDKDDCPDEAARVIDLDGKTLMPGIIDSHVHSSMSGIDFNGIDLGGIDSSQEYWMLLRNIAASKRVPGSYAAGT